MASTTTKGMILDQPSHWEPWLFVVRTISVGPISSAFSSAPDFAFDSISNLLLTLLLTLLLALLLALVSALVLALILALVLALVSALVSALLQVLLPSLLLTLLSALLLTLPTESCLKIPCEIPSNTGDFQALTIGRTSASSTLSNCLTLCHDVRFACT
jgi:hypothetical protein